MREIFLEITNEYIKQSSTFGGVQGAGNVTAVILCFDKSWDGFAKTLTWFDAYGENPVQQVLGIDKAQDGEGRAYRVTVPPEALKEWGSCSLVIDGYKDHARAKSLTAHFEVEPCSEASYATESQDPTPTVAEQLQGEIEDIRETIFKAEESAEAAAASARQAQGYTANPPYPADKVWYLWNGTEYVKSAEPSVGKQGEKGDKGDTGDAGADGKDGAVDYSLVANALKGSASGAVISLDDVSSLEHMLKVKAQSKNIIPFPYYNESGVEDNGITYTYGADGVIHATGTSTAASRFYFVYTGNYKKPISAGTYTLSITGTGLDGTNTEAVVYVNDELGNHITGMVEAYYGKAPKTFTFSKNAAYYCFVYIPAGVTLDSAEIRVQIESGTTATEYAPYVDVSGTNVLVNETEYPVNADGTVEGVRSISPNMTITSDTANVVLDAQYNKDINKTIETLTQAIASLGGNV